MKTGAYYVVRIIPDKDRGDSLKLESRAFHSDRDIEARSRAAGWRDYVADLNPDHEVILIKVMSSEDENERERE